MQSPKQNEEETNYLLRSNLDGTDLTTTTGPPRYQGPRQQFMALN